MTLIDRCLAIEFTFDRVRLALFTKRFSKLSSVGSAEILFSEGIRDEEVGELILDAIGEHRLQARKIVVGLPSEDFMFQHVTLPFVEMESIRPMLEFELDKHIPFTAGEVYFDYAVIPSGDEGSRELLLVAMERKVLKRYYDMLSSVGLVPAAIIPASSALALYGNSVQGFGDSENDIAGPVYTFFLKRMSSGFELSFTRGEGLVAIEKYTPAQEEFDKKFITGNSVYSAMKHLGLVTGKRGSMGISQELVDMDDLLNDENIENIRAFAPALSIKKPGDCSVASLLWPEKPADGFETVTALGLGFLNKNEVELNLLPVEMRGGEGHYGAITAAVLGGICIVLTIGIMTAQTIQDSKTLKMVENEINRLSSQVEIVKQLEKESKDLEATIKDYDKMVGRKFIVLDLLRDMSNTIPAETWLTRLEITNEDVKLTGYARNISDVADLKIKLDKIDLLEDIEELTQSSMRTDKYYFRIGARLTMEK